MTQKSYFANSPLIHWLETIVTMVNAILICLLNMGVFDPMSQIHSALGRALQIFLYAFAAQEFVRLVVLKKRYFQDHRNIFSALVLIAAIYWHIPEITILLLFNSFRAFRLLNSKKTRHVIDTLFHVIPGAMNLLVLIFMTFFVFAVLATKLFGEHVPHLWGTLGQSLLSLQQVMLGDDWGNNLRETMKFYPYAWILSTSFLILVSFILLNVFIGVIVDAMQQAEEGNEPDTVIKTLQKEIGALRKEINLISSTLTKQK